MTDLRPANSDDAPACAKIMQDWLDATEWMPNLHTLEGTVKFCRNQLIGAYDTTVSGNPVRGFISVEPDNCIAALYTAPTGRGLGTKLLNHAKFKRTNLNLWVFQSNTRAIQFYDRHGFNEIRRTDGENEENLPDILMEWRS